MDISTAAVGSVVLQLFRLYDSGRSAWQTPGFGKEEVEFLKELSAALAKARDATKTQPTVPDQLRAIVTAAFLRTYYQHWAQDKRLLAQQRAARAAAVARCLEMTIELDTTQRQLVASLPELLGSPLRTPYYKALWAAFTAAEAELLSVSVGTAKNEFEANFCANYASLMATTAGKSLAADMSALDIRRTELTRMLIAQDTLSWMNRHVLGNVRQHAELGPMPLGSMYVEPYVKLHDQDEPVPIQRWFDTQLALAAPAVLIVSADFGHGKSLSARYLASRLALSYLQATEPSAECWYPVYVRAGEDLTATENTVDAIVARAMRRQANDPEGLQLSLNKRDEALTLPDGHTLVIIDGFDEIALPPAEIERFFQTLDDESSQTQRFVVLGRPESLYEVTNMGERWRTRIAHIQRFERSLAADWLRNWNDNNVDRRPVEWEALNTPELSDLIRTPVLLFMAAFTLSDPRATTEAAAVVDATTLYESFCKAMARGKLAQSGERHQVIERSASTLADALESGNWSLGPAANNNTQERLSQAMLWLMSRVAWEAYVRGDLPLRKRHIEDLLERVVGVNDSHTDAVVIGSLLALQANLASGQTLMFFGHRSFQEYLAARFWHKAVEHLGAMPSRTLQRDFEEKNLLGAALVNIEQAHKFLMELERRELRTERRALVQAWADGCFCDTEDPHPVVKQRRPPLRAAALAIACIQAGFDLTRSDRRMAFVSLVAFNWIHLMTHNRWLLFSVPGAKFDGIDLRAANLHRISMQAASLRSATLKFTNCGSAALQKADFSGADLTGARFDRADLQQVNLSNAMARDSLFDYADLRDADLRSANFQYTSAYGAIFFAADLTKAVFLGAHLESAHFDEANLTEADLCNANLAIATLAGANLMNAKLHRANLSNADLTDANLSGARLAGANLWGAKLTGANLSGADLTDANLMGANLSGTNLTGVDLTSAKLTGCEWSPADLPGANLANANLSVAMSTRMRGTVLVEANAADAAMTDALPPPETTPQPS